MSPKVTGKQDTKTLLLQVGIELMMEKGYTNTGIQEVLNILNVPKGSFYHYFDSKESYAVEIIHYFDRGYTANLLHVLKNPEQGPLERLNSYCEQNKSMLASQQCRKGCLIGNLGQEMSDQSEVLRTELSSVMDKWRAIIADCIEEGQNTGEIKSTRSAMELAELFSSGWSGAVLRAKTLKSTAPLDTFMELMIKDVLKAC